MEEGGQRALLAAIRSLRARGEALALCLVAATSGSTYRKAGALAVVSAGGTRHGVISGGCLESGLEAAAAQALATRSARSVLFDTQGDDDLLFGSGSGCRGRMRVLIVPVPPAGPHALCDALLRADRERVALRLALLLDDPQVAEGWAWLAGEALPLGTAPRELLAMAALPAGERLVNLHGSSRSCAVLEVRACSRLLLIGAGPEAPALIRIGQQLGWYVTVLDHRDALLEAHAGLADERVGARPAAALAQCPQTAQACVIMTHSAANDLEALRALALRSEPYVGLLGPPARRDELLRQLDEPTRARLAPRLRAPVGLQLGGHGPEALALSIAAQLHEYLSRTP